MARSYLSGREEFAGFERWVLWPWGKSENRCFPHQPPHARPTPSCTQHCWAHSLSPWGHEGTAHPHDCGAAVEEGPGEPGAGGKEEGEVHPIIQGQ